MKCKLAITSRGKDWKNNVNTTAEMTIEGETATICYPFEGDMCTLEINEKMIVQTRKGEVNLKLSFRKGIKTFCIIGDEGLRGGYAIDTRHMKVAVGKKGCMADLRYLSGEDEERVEVAIRAVAKIDNE